ncbi:MAG: ABC transporter substrate-binding protein [Alphaproteobacteria bacterium]|nr:ABC transporter substrate-binding protein [Alphaproteobacteria bacterium]
MRKILLVIFLLLSSAAHAIPSRNLTIFAETNLSQTLIKISRLYSQKSNVVVSVNFNSSADLIVEINSGEPADVFISTNPNQIESLKQRGLVDVHNIGYIARNNKDNTYYQALVIAGDNMDLAREFLKFLKSDAAKAIFKESGFLTD